MKFPSRTAFEIIKFKKGVHFSFSAALLKRLILFKSLHIVWKIAKAANFNELSVCANFWKFPSINCYYCSFRKTDVELCNMVKKISSHKVLQVQLLTSDSSRSCENPFGKSALFEASLWETMLVLSVLRRAWENSDENE